MMLNYYLIYQAIQVITVNIWLILAAVTHVYLVSVLQQ